VPAAKVRIASLYAPEKSRKTHLVEGAPAAAAKELVRLLREEARVI
jgi:electron transfer flavoprotein alpha/beta subunit